jgi:uncharacterized RDD family membrane protein YckC
MKPAARKFFLLFLASMFVLLIAPAPGARAAGGTATVPYELLAHGNAQALWVAEVGPPQEPQSGGAAGAAGGASRTIFRFRSHGDFANWQPMGEVASRVVQLSDRGSELIVLLETGEWMMVSDSGVRSGVSLPGRGDIVAIAGDAESVWAIGEHVIPPATTAPAPGPAPATASASASTAPAPSPAPAPTRSMTTATSPVLPTAPLGLFSLEQGEWQFQSPLPSGSLRGDIRSMVLLNHQPLVAFSGRESVLRLRTFMGSKGWSEGHEISPVDKAAAVNLLNFGGRPVLAVKDAHHTSMYVGGEKWTGPVRLLRSPEMGDCKYEAVVAALGQLRVICSGGPNKLIEQPYNLDGQPAGKANSATRPPTIAMDRLMYVLIIIAIFVFLGVMFGAMGRKAAIAKAAEKLEDLNLAPLGARFGAGFIDATPFLIASFIATPSNVSPDAGTHLTVEQALWLAAGLAVYVLHTAIMELATGRSFGKMLFGLRVTGLDGKPAPAWAIIVRNLLRVIDVILLFPLTLMVFLPLRQRLGDLAAGTLVVADPVVEEEEEPGEDAGG